MLTQHRIRDRLLRLLAAYPVVIAALSALNLVAPQRGGPLALSQVFAPHLLIPVVVLAPVAVAVVRAPRALRLGVVIALAIGAVRFGPGLVSIPPTPPAQDETVVRIVSWNLEGGAPAAAELVAQLRASDADIVALQELTPEHAAAIRADAEVAARFSHTALVPRTGVGGIGILSRFPITLAADGINPVVQEVELELPDRRLTVVNAHPFPPRYRLAPRIPLPLNYDPAQRDADILRVREPIDRAIAAARPLFVIGDFNLTDREPAFDDLSRGLWDAHDEVGQGTGSTWRPRPIEFVPFGILRIDHFLGGPGTRPLSVSEDCAPRRSDHCILSGSAAIGGSGSVARFATPRVPSQR
jgi:endonuclease/exonuclease/phosphatase (EEP) superfamily protein YafD